MTPSYEEVITTRERLRELYGQPSRRACNKVIDRIDGVCRRFIAACPFVVVASRGADGRLDISPKGDPSGFVAVLDEKTLAIPDRVGNNRLDTFDNLLAYPEVGLLFIHCPKCIARAKLWSPDHWPDRGDVPSLAEALVAHATPAETVADVQAAIDDHNKRLY
jgi:predicted pyridoxine 5'-phosphate oxidase superfamily flavin-nucleotide-binding protein